MLYWDGNIVIYILELKITRASHVETLTMNITRLKRTHFCFIPYPGSDQCHKWYSGKHLWTSKRTTDQKKRKWLARNRTGWLWRPNFDSEHTSEWDWHSSSSGNFLTLLEIQFWHLSWPRQQTIRERMLFQDADTSQFCFSPRLFSSFVPFSSLSSWPTDCWLS